MTNKSIEYMGTIIPFDFSRSSDLNEGSMWKLFHTIPSGYHSLKNASTSRCTSTWVSFIFEPLCFRQRSSKLWHVFKQCVRYGIVIICHINLISQLIAWDTGPLFTKKTPSYSIGIPMINLRRSDDRLRFIMGIPILIRRRLLSE